jgi:predicted nucleic acid-binding protein
VVGIRHEKSFMSGPVFVDTNVLVYARDDSERHKQRQAREWMGALWTRRAGRLSMQVLHEFYVTVTQRLRPGLSRDEARRDVRDLLAWRPLPLDDRLIEATWSHQDRHALSFWGALVVAAANLAGCEYLLTEDLHDGQPFDGTTVLNPFTHAADEVS